MNGLYALVAAFFGWAVGCLMRFLWMCCETRQSQAMEGRREVEEGGTNREDTSTGDGGADERIELLVTADGELKVTGGDTLDAKILGRVTYTVKKSADRDMARQ